MADKYSAFLRRRLPGVSFRQDSGWSWLLSLVTFLYLAFNFGLVHSLGVFFKMWMTKYEVSEVTLIWVQSAFYATNQLGSPLVINLVKKIPGQIVLAVGSIINCITFIITAYAGNGSFKKKCQQNCSFVFCWSFLLYYSDKVHEK